MQHVLRHSSYGAIGIVLSAFPANFASAQNTPAPAFCPSPTDTQGTDAIPAPATPSVSAGVAALNTRNYPQAYANLQPLAEMGDIEAERDLGRLLRQSCGPNGDKSAALSWFRKAAAAGDAQAAAALGEMYMNGEGVAQDDKAAFGWLTQAANAGNLNAQTELGELYFSGRGVAQDRYQGLVWSVRVSWVHAWRRSTLVVSMRAGLLFRRTTPRRCSL